MTAAWDRLLETSTGRIAFRLAFDGIGTEFVSTEEMARARVAETDVERVLGLNTQGLKLDERGDLVRAKWEPSGYKLRVTAEAGAPLFHQDPGAVTYLDQDRVTDTDTSFAVTGAEAFGATGVFYMGTETFHFASRTALSFATLTRGLWSVGGQAAQYHYRSGGGIVSDDRLAVPEITDRPVVFEGRRTYLYVYAPGDDPQGDGTRIWAGICSTEPVLDGDFWSWTIDGLDRLFAYDLASDLADKFGLSGIYYGVGTHLVISIVEWSAATRPDPDTDTVLNRVDVRLIGLFANQEEFLAAINHILDTETSTWSGWSVATTGGVRAEARGASWGLIYRAASGTQKWIELHVDSLVDGTSPGLLLAQAAHGAPWLGELGGFTVIANGESYLNLYRQPDGSYDIMPPGGGGTVPRVAYAPVGTGTGALVPGVHSYTYETSDGTFDPANLSSGFTGYAQAIDRLAMNAPVTMVPGRTSLTIEWDALDPAPTATLGGELDGRGTVIDEVGGIVAPEGAPRVSTPAGTPILIATSENPPEFRVERMYVASGSFADFIQQLLDDRAEFLNLGLVPDLRPDDFDEGWDDELRELAAHASLYNSRTYVAGKKIDLDEMIQHELRLLGAHAHFSLEGRVRFRALRPPSDVEVVDATIDLDQLVIDGGWHKYEPAQIGIFNQVHHSTGYDPLEDEYSGQWNFRWMPGYSRVPGGRTLEVAPKSVDPPRLPEHDSQRILGAQRVLSTFGERYAVLTCGVLLELFPLVVGDVVAVTWSKLPNRSGGFGASVNARVIGRSCAPTDDGYVTLTLLISRVRYGGYAPGARCESITGTSGGTGPFEVTVDLAAYFPGGTDLADFLRIDDEIEVYRWNHRVADRHDAVVTAVDESTLTFTTATPWTHAGFTWAWGARKASAYNQGDNLAAFAFEADASSRINFADAPAPRLVFAP